MQKAQAHARCIGAAVALILLASAPLAANGESAALRARASDHLYNLDRDQAATDFRQAIAADPNDAAAYRGLASALWLMITFRRGNMTVDDYIGHVTKAPGPPGPPPPDLAAAFNDALNKAMTIARARVAANPRDADAHYQLGAAVGLRASYAATVEGSMMGAFRAAREAYHEHEQVMSLDPKRKDAALIVGTYTYVVSVLALPLRVFAYVAGFGGGKEKGITLIEEAAAFGGDNQADARFALVLVYNREKRYDDALRQLAILRDRYPRNRLAWLESGSTCLRAGRPSDAGSFLEEGMRRFADDNRPRMFGENALWRYKRGAARAGTGHAEAAAEDLNASIGLEGRNWVHGRAHLELGKLAVARNDQPAARREFQAAATLSDGDNDATTAEEARRLLSSIPK